MAIFTLMHMSMFIDSDDDSLREVARAPSFSHCPKPSRPRHITCSG